MSLLSTCRSTAPAPARMMTSAVPFLILFLAGVSFAERYWVTFGARRRHVVCKSPDHPTDLPPGTEHYSGR